MANAYDQINEVISLRNEVARLQQKLDGLKKQAVPPQEPEKREMPSEPLPPHYEKETGSVSAITVPHRRRETEIDYPWGFVLKIGIGVLIVGLIFIVVYFMYQKKNPWDLWIGLAFLIVLALACTVVPFCIFLYNVAMRKNAELNAQESKAYESQKKAIEAVEEANASKKEKYEQAAQKFEEDTHYIEKQYPVLLETYQKKMVAYKNALPSLENEINKTASELDEVTAKFCTARGPIPDDCLESPEMMDTLKTLAENNPSVSLSGIVDFLYQELAKLKPIGIFSARGREELEYIVKHNAEDASEQLVFDASGNGRPEYRVIHDEGSDHYEVFAYGENAPTYKVRYYEDDDVYVVERAEPDRFALNNTVYVIKKRFADSGDYFVCDEKGQEAIWRIGKLENED
jgi:hypothetical protein